MVKRGLLGLAGLALAGAASGQTLDWGQSGGTLFGAGALEPEPAPAAVPVRLSEPDQPFAEAIETAARAHGLEPKLLHALVLTESGYRPDAVSPASAGGLTQLMPGTARDLGVRDRFDPEENLRGGADYLARQILRFGDLRLALAAYNSGPERVARLGRVPDIAETQAYVTTVIECYLALSAGRTVVDARRCGAPEAGR